MYGDHSRYSLDSYKYVTARKTVAYLLAGKSSSHLDFGWFDALRGQRVSSSEGTSFWSARFVQNPRPGRTGNWTQCLVDDLRAFRATEASTERSLWCSE